MEYKNKFNHKYARLSDVAKQRSRAVKFAEGGLK